MIREVAPSVRLREWVDAFWMSEPSSSSTPFTVLPDNCCDALFDLDAAQSFAVGAMTAPLVLPPGSAPAYLGIRFQPGRARAFFELPMHLVADQRVPIRSTLAEQLAEAPDDEARVSIAERAIEARLARAAVRDRRVDDAVTRFLRRNDSIEQVAAAVGMTRQHLRRRFLEEVGLSPKTFARVARFRRLLQDAHASRGPSWAALAADHGYSDQSHLIAEFQALAGSSPVPFFLSR
jgi:AraC-like DNA-binding protein